MDVFCLATERLYQNLVKKIENIAHLRNLTVLDLSFNKIRLMDSLATCNFLQLERLYLSSNKITDVEGIFHLTNLKMLELGSNRIRSVPPEIASLVHLEELWLGKNKITSMTLPPLPRLRHMSLQNNRLEVWEPAFFQNLSGLTHLYLGHNNLPDLPEEFALLTNLVEVDLVRNAITLIKPLPELKKLEELWMNDNKIEDLQQISHLEAFCALKTIYLERNPMQDLGNKEAEQRYREAILKAVPHIQQIDAERVDFEVKVISDGTERHVMGIRRSWPMLRPSVCKVSLQNEVKMRSLFLLFVFQIVPSCWRSLLPLIPIAPHRLRLHMLHDAPSCKPPHAKHSCAQMASPWQAASNSLLTAIVKHKYSADASYTV